MSIGFGLVPFLGILKLQNLINNKKKQSDFDRVTSPLLKVWKAGTSRDDKFSSFSRVDYHISFKKN